MPRALWKGSITFGLVNIPIELHTAVRDHRPKFRMLHAKDKSPVRFERVCVRDGTAVAWEDLVKGYEYQRGRFVVMTKEDFQAAAVEKTRTVDIIDFVEASEIDDRFFETPYYLVPVKGGERAYALLREDQGRPLDGARQAARWGPTGRCARGIGGALDRFAHVAFLSLSAVRITYPSAVTDATPFVRRRRAPAPRFHGSSVPPPAQISKSEAAPQAAREATAPCQAIGPECLMSFCSVVEPS